jgi:hypothetical protein
MENLQKPVMDELVALATAEASNRSLRKKRDNLEIELARAIELTLALDSLCQIARSYNVIRWTISPR